MISEETLLKVTRELDGLNEEQFINEVCHMFMVLMVSGGISECVYGIPQHGAALNYNSGTIFKDMAESKLTFH